MKFASIEGDLSTNYPHLCDIAQDKFDKIILELALRQGNIHVGSGLGGNGTQLHALLGLRHYLVTGGDIETSIHEQDVVRWDYKFLIDNSISIIRGELDHVFPEIAERAKHVVVQSDMAFAHHICKELAHQLDAGDTSNIGAVGNQLSVLPLEVILQSVRTKITIGRLIMFNIDEHPAWQGMLERVNNVVK